ncbi:MAG: phosphoenolpyruvate--protein phosphotransferase [Lachnospiraceae bacterium]|nr:phosphoenolpyruvate--protein phosphotransferase [Lachnospiraceae bacterium]
MLKIEGKSLSQGAVIGKMRFYRAPEYEIDEGDYDDSEAEIKRFDDAREVVKNHLMALAEAAEAASDSEGASVFESHVALLDDKGLIRRVKEFITDMKKSAEFGVKVGFEDVADDIRSLPDPYISKRSDDILELEREILQELIGSAHALSMGDDPYILAAYDLTAAEVARLDRFHVIAIVMKEGNFNTHASILVKGLGIPCVIRAESLAESYDGREVIVDGTEGIVIVEPDEATVKKYDEVMKKNREFNDSLLRLRGKMTVTKDGREVRLYANISNPYDVATVLDNDASGIGLFRSDYLFLKDHDYPEEDEQFMAYRMALEDMKPRSVIIRTVDIGSDKSVPYLQLPKENNPAIGMRAIRISLTRKDFFKTQLRALLRASAYGNLRIIFPMITNKWELVECKKLLAECEQELRREGVKIGRYKTGVMIETPASVFIVDQLAEEVDFFSVGTNDLTQFTLAIDRENPDLDPFYDPYHPAIMEEIRMTVEAGHRHGCLVGICGELAGDTSLTETFLRMGVDELSVNPQFVLPLRQKIRDLDLSKTAEK